MTYPSKSRKSKTEMPPKKEDTTLVGPPAPTTGPLPMEHTEAQFLVQDSEAYEPSPLGVETQRDSMVQQSRVAGCHAPQRLPPDNFISSDDWQKLVSTLRVHRRRLLSIPGVTAVDIGYKLDTKKGAFTNEVALRVHVERKRPIEYFLAHRDELISISKEHEKELAKETTQDTADKLKRCSYQSRNNIEHMDVLEAKYLPSAQPLQSVALEPPRRTSEVDRRRRIDPLVGGVSIGSPSTPVGTLGALVWDKTDGTVCILSNWHVLAGDPHAEAGSPCFQPGRFDRGSSSDIVARLKRWSFDNETDAAIAQLTGDRHYCAGEILDLYQQITGEQDPYLGMVVLKSGRSSGVTWGFVDGLHFSTIIQYSNGIVREFEDQIHIAPLPPLDESTPVCPISDTGDSGSVWVTKCNGSGYRAVGLHFAGDLPRSSFGEYALANPIKTVKERLNFSFRPRFLEIRDEDVTAVTDAAIQPASSRRGIGTEPVRFVDRGLTGPGGQPDPVQAGGTGKS